MSLTFSFLKKLSQHTRILHNIFPIITPFIVGGTIRDLLLGRTDSPTDIDLTCQGDPDQIRETMQFDENTMSRFRTEKFGTMTLIPKNDDGSSSDLNYELTPFRAESDYTDNRHPDQIQRSDSLVDDSARRDFTINALYWTTTTGNITSKITQSISKKNLFQNCLEKQLAVVIPAHSLLILTDHQQIEACVTQEILPLSAMSLQQDTRPDHAGRTVAEQSDSLTITQVLIDPQGGLIDLLNRKIKTVGDPATRYQEDALRLMRGLRFVNTLNQGLPGSENQNSGFDFDRKTREQLVGNADLIAHVASERHQQELHKVFSANNPFGYTSLLKTAGLLPHLFPALSETIDNHQPTRHHALDTFSHTLMVLYHLQQRVTDPLVRFATLYHDVGKPEQYEFMEKAKAANPDKPDREGFEHHADISVRLAEQDLTRLAFPKASIQKICRYIKWHHRPGEILDSTPKKRDHKLRKLMSDGGYQETMRLIDIAIADRLGQYNPIQTPAIQQLLDLQARLTQMHQSEGRFTRKDLIVNGNRLMKRFDLDPGPELGELLDKIFEWVLGDVKKRNTEKEIILLVRGLLK